ncbi:MAG: putative adenine-specific DNA-methyltransferase [Parcubacteria group bacterium Licking1014_1]|nr:MAG: putative adenine-specific DNA-methyltransferase [Parcubacteria group bacterium Licking1014_1]
MSNFINKIYNEDCFRGIGKIEDGSIDLILTDPPYCLGKDYGNDSDMKNPKDYLEWTYKWIDLVIPKLKESGSMYLFLSWQYSPEIFSYIKTKMRMINEIIWDRRVPSMGGSTRRFTSVHDNIGVFVKKNDYYFDIDEVRISYDEKTKKARSRSIFVGAKWLEVGYNPKDVWSHSRLHKQDPEREKHPTQKPLAIIDRIVKASSPQNGIVFDPFMGSGTTAISCIRNNRKYTGFEINKNYYDMIQKRILKENNNLFFNRSSVENQKEMENVIRSQYPLWEI